MSLKRKTAVSVLATALIAAITGMALTFSAFSSTTDNSNNEFRSGDVVLTDNDAQATLFSMSGMLPGSKQAKCLTVDYSGSLKSLVKLYATTASSTPAKDLAPYLDLKVTRGSFPGVAPADMACTGFTADATDYAAKGAGVLYDDTLASYPADWAGALEDPATWVSGDKAVYQVSVSLKDTDSAQAKDATTKLVFEARDKGTAGQA
jgi:hypothetical protein